MWMSDGEFEQCNAPLETVACGVLCLLMVIPRSLAPGCEAGRDPLVTAAVYCPTKFVFHPIEVPGPVPIIFLYRNRLHVTMS